MPFNAKKFVKNINNQQWDNVEKLFHKNVEFSNPFCPTPVKGVGKVKEVMSEEIHVLPNYEYRLVKYFMDDETASIELERKGGKIIWKGLPYVVQYKIPEVMLLDFKDGKISRVRGIFDAGHIMRGLEKAMEEKDKQDLLGRDE
ncbi:nuclear transport factor 2 family protein [candidate division KSB1 bacterium]